VAHPGLGVCVVTVNGELDLLTAPLLDACVREQLAACPLHLVLNLQPVRFLSARGLTCLQQAGDLTQQIPGSQLHLTGLVTRVVARPLQITGCWSSSTPIPPWPTLLLHWTPSPSRCPCRINVSAS
jgi:anti-sigma B factor antagonist